MKQAAITGTQQATVIDKPDLEPFDNWVVVKVHAAPMCTEYKRFLSGEPTETLGHEAAGEVVAVAQPGRVKVGDRVVAMPLYGCGECTLCLSGDYIHCQNVTSLGPNVTQLPGRATYAQYLLKQDWLLPKIPQGVSYEYAALACCGIGPSFGAMQRMNVNAFDTVLITGLGPVGLGAAINARFRGARVIAVDSVPSRIDRARKMGATAVLDPQDEDNLARIAELTGGHGVDCALDCSGSIHAQRFCIDATRRRGQLCFIGECNDDLAIQASRDLIRKGLTLMGAWHYNLNDFPSVMQVIQESPLINQLISHRFAMSNIQEAFTCSASGDAAKIMLDPWS